MVYILKHPQKDFCGYVLGVQFHMGRGATSSAKDRDILTGKFKVKGLKIAFCQDITGQPLAVPKSEPVPEPELEPEVKADVEEKESVQTTPKKTTAKAKPKK